MSVHRLDSFLSRSGVSSRRNAKLYIKERKIRVNGQICTETACKIDSNVDVVLYQNKKCEIIQDHSYFAFHKPVKVESSNKTQKEHAMRKTARSFLDPLYKGHLFSIGRLDYLSSGLLLFCNDGELAYVLTHPKFEIPKTYYVKSTRKIPLHLLRTWKQGISIESVTYTLDSFTLLDHYSVELQLHEGKNKEIRKVFEEFSLPIVKLIRTSFAGIQLGELAVAETRTLEKEEIEMLHQLHTTKTEE